MDDELSACSILEQYSLAEAEQDRRDASGASTCSQRTTVDGAEYRRILEAAGSRPINATGLRDSLPPGLALQVDRLNPSPTTRCSR